MKDFLNSYFNDFKRNRGRRRRLTTVLCMLSLAVAIGVFWQLRIVGITMTDEACCGMTEHVHTDECIPEKVLICGLEEGEGCTVPEHVHDSSCYEKRPVLVCGKQEHVHSESCYEEVKTLICTEDHEHTEACYKTERVLTCTEEEHTHNEQCYEEQDVLVCGLEEHVHSDSCPKAHTHTEACYKTVYSCGMEEHTHSPACYSDPEANKETPDMWETTLPETLSGVWTDDLIDTAVSQLGYTESTRNFVPGEDGVTEKGYTRYGQWYGSPYGDWNTMFLSFCLHYTGVPEDVIKPSAGAFALVSDLEKNGFYHSAESDYVPVPGDIIFFSDGERPSRGAVIRGISRQEELITGYTVIEGDAGNAVAEKKYPAENPEICGFASIGEAQESTEEAELMSAPQPRANDLQIMKNVTSKVVLTDHAGDPIEDGAHVDSGKIYHFQVEINAANGLKPGEYTYSLPAGVSTVGKTGDLKIDQTVIGTYTIDKKGNIVFVLNKNANSYTNLKFFASGDLEFDANAGDIDFDGNIIVHIKPTHEKPKEVIKKTGVILKNTSKPKQIKWTLTLSSVPVTGSDGTVSTKAVIGQTITDTLDKNSVFDKNCRDRGLLFTAIEEQPDGTSVKHQWTAKAPEVTWGADGRTWSYTMPSEVDLGKGKMLTLNDKTMHYSVVYRSSITPDEYVGKVKNTGAIANKTDSASVNYRGENPQNIIVKDGFYNAVTNRFTFTINANIPAVTPSADGKSENFAWHINDAASVPQGREKLGLVMNPDNMKLTLSEGTGAEVSVPYCKNVNGEDYCWAIGYPAEVTGNAIPKSVDIWLLHKCTCTTENCSHKKADNKPCIIPQILNGDNYHPADQTLPAGYCVCWHNTEPVHVKIDYSLSKEDTERLISDHAGYSRDLLNTAALYSMTPKANGYEAIKAADDSIRIPIPGVFNKDILTEPGNTNEYIASFKITVNEGKQVLVNPGESLVIQDKMSGTLVYIKGSMSVTAEDDQGVVRTLHPREYTITPETTVEQGVTYHNLLITVLNPEKVKYTLKYQAKLDTAGASGSVDYSNTAVVNLWGRKFEDTITKRAMNVEVSGEQYVVTVTKHGVNADGPALPGAAFGLYSQNNDQISNGVTDAQGQITFRTDVTAGIIFRKHEPYYLYELQAPAEYRSDGRPHWFYFFDPDTDPDHSSAACKELEAAHPGIVAIPTGVPGDIHITNLPAGSAELPATGGSGFFYYLPGILLTASAAALGIKKKSRSHERRPRG